LLFSDGKCQEWIATSALGEKSHYAAPACVYVSNLEITIAFAGSGLLSATFM